MAQEDLDQYTEDYLNEKKYHWMRLSHLATYLVPTIIDLAHSTYATHTPTSYPEHMRLTIQKASKTKLTPAIFRTIWRKLEVQDDWLKNGGPSSPKGEDVRKEAPINLEELFGINNLLSWAEIE
jgi:hypothetical protein